VLGSPSKEEFAEFAKRVPFDAELFKEFQHYEPLALREKLKSVSDLDNLLDLLGEMFQYLPERRITATQALRHPFFKSVGRQN